MKKKLIPLLLSVTMLLTPVFIFAADVTVTIDGSPVIYSEQMGYPYIDSSSRTQVPLNQTMTSFGASVLWDSETRSAVVTKDDIEVRIPIGEKYIEINSERKEIDTAALIKDGRTYLPIAHVLRAFGASVGWEGSSHTVIVTTTETTSTLPDTPASKTPDSSVSTKPPVKTSGTYMASLDSDKYHYPTCRFAQKIEPENVTWFDTAEEAEKYGYTSCGVCHPK